jgi:hypothetical protein
VYASGVGWTGIYIDRYALAAMIGVAILLGFLIHAAGAKPMLVGLVVVILCIATGRNAFQLLTKPRTRGISAVLAARASNAPVISGNPFVYIQTAYYAQSAGVRYIVDPVEARLRTGSDAPDIGLLALRPWAHLDVEEYSAFALRRESFLLYWRPDRFSWILPKLRASGVSIELLAEEGDEQLYSVAWP